MKNKNFFQDARVYSFMALAEQLNFSKAASTLYISQQALSAQIASLEADLGVRLFIRTTRSVSLTEVGLELYELFTASKQSLEQILMHARSKDQNVMRIVYFEDMDIGSQLISTRDACLKEYPDVDFTFSYRAYFSDIIQALEGNDADLAIAPHGSDFSTAAYSVQPIIKDSMLNLYFSPALCPNAAKNGYALGDLRDATFFVGTECKVVRDLLEERCREYGYSPKFYERKITPSVERMLIESGQGVGMGDRYSLLHRNTQLSRIPLLPSDTLIAIWKKDKDSPLIKHFVRCLSLELRK